MFQSGAIIFNVHCAHTHICMADYLSYSVNCFAEYHSSSAALGSGDPWIISNTRSGVIIVPFSKHSNVFTIYNTTLFSPPPPVPYRVVVLCPEDGQRSVVEAAVGVCQLALKRGVVTQQVDTEMVNNRLAGEEVGG